MRPKYLIIAAIGLLILCSVLIIHQSGTTRRDTETSNFPTATASADKRAEVLGESPREASAPPLQTPRKAAVTDLPNDSAANVPRDKTAQKPNNLAAGNSKISARNDSRPPSTPSRESTSDAPPKGIRLADDVKLPAVILAINAAERDPQKNIPEPVKAAMRGIVDTFYRDLADSAAATQAPNSTSKPPDSATEAPDSASQTPEPTAAESVTEDDTIVIRPGPAVEEARERANETYRALFGDAAFDQMTMNALIESQLPAIPVTGE